jgi:eukaryotic-like serine/threonine-protein kinase
LGDQEQTGIEGIQVISKKPIPATEQIDRASEELRALVRRGSSRSCEEVLASYPDLCVDRDSVLELIYLEYVLRQDQGADLESNLLVDDYLQRFPDYAEDIVKLLQVDVAFSSLNTVGSDPFATNETLSSVAKWGPSIGVIGDYRLLEVLGHGGMGVVYRAIQERLGRVVALKTIQATGDIDSAAILRFQREAELASSLQHPNIAQIYEVGTHNELPFYSMEYVSAGSLAQFLRDRPLKPELAASLVAVLARAVDSIHAQGVIHRDLKPANVLLSPSMRPEALEIPDSRKALDSKSGKFTVTSLEKFEPKIVDFGLAIPMPSNQVEAVNGRAVGTPSYMSPEQINPAIGVAGPATDVYALGSILYHALVGRPPFCAATTQETLRQVQNDDPISPRNLQPRIAGDLETICLKCLRKNPATRYQSAIDLANDLQRFLLGKPIQARPASFPRRVYKWGVRNPSLVCLMAAMAIAVVLTTWLWRQSEQSLSAELVERQRGEQLNYDRNVALAYHEFKTHSAERALELLDLCQPKHQNWEWHFIKGLCEEPIWKCESGESKRLVAASLSPNGDLVATGHGNWGQDIEQAVYVWNTDSNQLLWKLVGHPKSEVAHVHFHPHKKRLLSSAVSWENGTTQPGLVIEWDLETGQSLRTIDTVNARISRYSHDGQSIYVGDSNGRVRFFDAESGAIRHTSSRSHGGMILGLCESRDGQYLISTARNGTLGIWETGTGKEIVWREDMGDPRSIDWSPDMKKIYMSGFGGQVDVFRWKNNSLEHESVFTRNNTQCMTHTPDGRMIATAALGESVDLRDAQTGRTIRNFHGHLGNVRGLCFDGYGRKLLTAGANGTCHVWDLTGSSGLTMKTLGSEGVIADIDFHPKLPRFVVGMSVQRTKPTSRSGRPRLEIWDTISNRSIKSLWGHDDWLTTVRFSSDGERIVSGSRDKTVRLWNPDLNEEIAIFDGHQDVIVMVSFWSSNRTVSVDRSGVLKIWDNDALREIDSWKVISDQHESNAFVESCVVDERSGLLAVGGEGTITLWDLSTGKELVRVPMETTIEDLKFSSDGSRLGVAAGTIIDVFDVSNVKRDRILPEPMKLRGHSRQVSSISFSPDGKRLATTGYDETMRVFELELGNEVLNIDDAVGSSNHVAFSRNGKQLVLCEGRVVHTYSIDPSDNRSETNSEKAITSWHNRKLRLSIEQPNPVGAAFHAKVLMEREPGNLAHKLNFAQALTDQGRLKEAVECLQNISPQRPTDRSIQLSILIRCHLLLNQSDKYRECCKQYETTAKEVDQVGYWNNLAWFVALGKCDDVDLKIPLSKLEETIKQNDVEIARIDQQSKQLEERQRMRRQSLKNGETASDASQATSQVEASKTPENLAEKKKQLTQVNSFSVNTLSLVYYRLGEYQKAIDASKKSIAYGVATNYVVATPPLDHIIQAMCLFQMEPSKNGSVDLSKPLESAKKLFIAAAPQKPKMQDMLNRIDYWMRRQSEKQTAVNRSSTVENRAYQLEIPLLLSELNALLDSSDMKRTFSTNKEE